MKQGKTPEWSEPPDVIEARKKDELAARAADVQVVDQRPDPVVRVSAAEQARLDAIKETGSDPTLPADQRPVSTWSPEDHLQVISRTRP